MNKQLYMNITILIRKAHECISNQLWGHNQSFMQCITVVHVHCALACNDVLLVCLSCVGVVHVSLHAFIFFLIIQNLWE